MPPFLNVLFLQPMNAATPGADALPRIHACGRSDCTPATRVSPSPGSPSSGATQPPGTVHTSAISGPRAQRGAAGAPRGRSPLGWLSCAVLLPLLMAFAGCSSVTPQVNAPGAAAATQTYMARANAQPQHKDGVEVRVAALQPAESQAVFGVPLAERGVQPVWVEIRNTTGKRYSFMPVFMDRDLFSPREVAYLFAADAGSPLTKALTQQQIGTRVRPGDSISGFVYTNTSRGIKLINVELAGDRQLLQFDFARDQNERDLDYADLATSKLYGPAQIRPVTMAQLGPALAAMPCCTTDAQGTGTGDPLNLAIIGSEREILLALVRAGWNFTEVTSQASVAKMVQSFVTQVEYLTSPVSPLFFEGRHQDFAMQRARHSISQRSHLRLWLTPLQVDGKPVWVGQVSRDIGVRLTTRSPFLTTHKIDPDVDESRGYLLQTLLMANVVSQWGLAPGVGRATEEEPRENLTGDPYFTDGRRLVLEIGRTPRAIPDVRRVDWLPPATTAGNRGHP